MSPIAPSAPFSGWSRRHVHQAILGTLGAMALPAIAQRTPALKLGVLLPLSGRFAAYTASAVPGIELAAKLLIWSPLSIVNGWFLFSWF